MNAGLKVNVKTDYECTWLRILSCIHTIVRDFRIETGIFRKGKKILGRKVNPDGWLESLDGLRLKSVAELQVLKTEI